MRSLKERIVHTGLFEIGAVVAVSPVIAWTTEAPMTQAGAVSLVVSLIATVCNYLWTMLFDRLVPTRQRGLATRIAQAVGLEIMISIFAIPVFYWLAGATLEQAVALDLAGLGFFIVYALIYNWVFDRIMLRIEAS